MGIKVTTEVIKNDLVTRFNGNNPTGGRQVTRARNKEAYGKKEKIIRWRKARAATSRYWKEVEAAWQDTLTG